MRRWLGALFALALLSTAELGVAQRTNEPVVRRVDVEHPEHLAHFHRALRELGRDPDRKVRVSHWGDSNVAADLWTAVTRDTLQARFGHGGSGYLLPRRHGSWHRGPVSLSTAGEWASRRRGFARDFGPNDGLWGIAGASLEPVVPHARIVATVPPADGPRTVEVHLLGRPRLAGSVEVGVDDAGWERVSLARPRPSLVVHRVRIDAGAHRVAVRQARGRPRVLGVVVERERGVVYDVLGINGHRASAILSWRVELLGEQLAERRPDLMVLSYGGNEALDPHLAMTTYETQTREAVGRLRRLAPDASCLLVGPLATYPDHAPRMARVTEIQRALAGELGCGFWDSSATSGGPGTLRSWARFEGMVGGDHLHLGRLGYERVGRRFVDALLRDL